MGNLEHTRPESTELWRSFLLRYGCAAVSIALATGVRLLLDPLLGDRSPFSILLFAVLLTSWYGGLRPGLVAVVLGLFLADYFLIPPRGSFVIQDLGHWVELVFYVALSGSIAVLGGSMQASNVALSRNLQRTQRALSGTEERLSVTLRSSGIATWSWDVAQNIILGR